MTQQIVLRSLEELGQFADVIVSDEPVSAERALVPQPPDPPTPRDLDDLVETLRRSAEELQGLSAADEHARKQAEQALAKYRCLTADAGQLRRIAADAEQVANQAKAFCARAFTVECHEGATRVVKAATVVADDACARLQVLNVEVEALSAREDVARLLVEEREREEAAHREAEERERQARLTEAIVEAEALASAGKFDEALRVLGSLAKEDPSFPDLASCIDKVRRREWAVKTSMAEEALRAARRNRRDPQVAVALIEPLDLTCVPDAVARQVYGCWLKSCHRLCRNDAMHYSVGFCKGAVLVETNDGQLEVLSAIGLPRWRAGRRFSRVALKGARPLK
jgi:hypothetical protein